jgi:KaiC/GvpD/RAD55 family RecA-like ATPase
MPDVYVPDVTKCFDGYKDMGELAQNKHQLGDVFSGLAGAMHAYRYKAGRMAQGFDLSEDCGRNQYIKACYEFDSTIFDPLREDELDSYFWPEVCRLINRDMDYILSVRDDMKKQERYERRQQTVLDLVGKVTSAFSEGNFITGMELAGQLFRAGSEAISDIPYQPIVPLSERLAENTAKLANRSGKTYLGLTQKTIEELDRATLGLRKMITIASGPGVGKTIFISQVVQDVLAAHEDACAVFVSWELTGDEIIDRMKSRALGVKWSELQLSSTPEQREKADALLAPIADRLVIIESANCAEKELTAEKLIREIDALKRYTGCKRCIVCVDYLQIFPVPDEVANSRSDVGRDDWIIREMKKVRYHLGDDPLLLVSEVNKNSGGMSGKGLEKIKGSGRVPYSSDAVFFLNPLSDEELVRRVHFHNGVTMPVGRYGDVPDVKKADIAKTAAAIRGSLLEQGKDYIELYISKIRDGGKRANILLTNNYELSYMESGIK